MDPALAAIWEAMLPLGLVLGGFLAGVFIRRVVAGRLTRAAQGTAWRGDDIIVRALGGPVVVWCTMLGLYAAMQVTRVPWVPVRVAQRVLEVLLVISVTWVAARLAGELIGSGASREDALRSPQLITNLVRMLILILGALVALQTLGIAVTPLVTALGVTGLAVGLALQDTLANLFAGIHILVSRQVHRGDFVRLSEGQEGVIEDITWRYTTIRQLSNITTTVPNSKLASAVTSIFMLRGGAQAILIPGSVTYDADLGLVEAIASAVAQEVMDQTGGAAAGFAPLIRFTALDDTRVRFTVLLAAMNREAQNLIRHEFIKRVRARFREAGLV